VSRLSMRKMTEIFRQRFDLHYSYRDIARSLNISLSTVSDYMARAKSSGLSWPLPIGMTEQALYEKLFLPVEPKTESRPLPDTPLIHQELRKKGVTKRLLWLEYRATHPTGLAYTQFCHHYHQYLKTVTPVMRQVHKAGEKCFVDYSGMKMSWLSIVSGEIHEAEIFVGCLGASQYTFVEATATQQLPDWIQSHVHMFEYFGGVSTILVPDNLKSGVTKAHRYDPDINANYQLMGEHYGVAIVPARALEPKDKAKVENAVGCIERQILAALRHHTFTSLGEINAAIKVRLAEFNQQRFQKMATSRHELFETLDKPALKPLPSERYAYAEWKKAKVHIDYHITFDDHHYSVPYKYIHQSVEIRATVNTVECYHQLQRISLHPRSRTRYGYSTLSEHMPKAHAEHAKWTPERLHQWANKIGTHTTQFIDQMIAARAFPEQAYRACLGILRLGEKFGEARLEKACDKANQVGATRYKQVESILKNNLEEVSATPEMSPPISDHDNIRGPNYYH